MSRGKGAYAAPAGDAAAEARRAEREEIRALTRELHEQVQAAKQAARELRDAKAEIWADAEKMLQALVNEAATALQEWANSHAGSFKEQQALLLETLQAIDRKIREKFAHMASEEFTPESFRDLIERDIAETVREEITAPGFTETVARVVVAQLDAETRGGLTRTAQLQAQIWSDRDRGK